MMSPVVKRPYFALQTFYCHFVASSCNYPLPHPQYLVTVLHETDMHFEKEEGSLNYSSYLISLPPQGRKLSQMTYSFHQGKSGCSNMGLFRGLFSKQADAPFTSIHLTQMHAADTVHKIPPHRHTQGTHSYMHNTC